jgi:glutaredoxin
MIAKNYLKAKGIEFTVVDVDADKEAMDKMIEMGFSHLPVIQLGDKYLEGFHKQTVDDYINSL